MNIDAPDRSAVEIVRERPALLVPGGVLAAFQLCFVLGIAIAVVRVGGLAVDLVTIALGTSAYYLARGVLGAGAIASIYGAASEAVDGGTNRDWATGGASVRRLLDHARDHQGAVLRGSLAARATGVVLVPVAVAAGLAAYLLVETAVGFAGYLLVGSNPAASPLITAVLGSVVAFVAGLAALAVSGLGEPLGVLNEEAADRWIGARYARADPRSTLGYVFLRGALLLVPPGAWFCTMTLVEATVGVNGDPVWVALAAMVAVAVGSFTHAVASAHAVTFGAAEVVPFANRTDRTGDASPTGSILARHGRTALVALLVVGLVAGTAGLRVADVRPGEGVGTTAAAPADAGSPGATVEAAHEAIQRTNHRATERRYAVNATTGERREVIRIVATKDYADRRLALRSRLRTGDEDDASYSTFRTYFGEGTVATSMGPDDWDRSHGPELTVAHRSAGEWQVFAAPGFGLAADGLSDSNAIAHDDADWHVVERTGDTVVLGIDDPRKLSEAGFFFRYGGDRLVDRGSYVRLHVDRDTGRPTRLVERRVLEVDGDEERRISLRVVEFSEYGSADVTRPDEVGAPGIAERIWDLAHY